MPRSFRTSLSRFSGVGYVLPSLIILTVILIVPIGISFYLSFTNYSVLNPGEWVGAKNYERMLTDATFHSALWHTVVYTLIAVPLQTVASLVLAALLARRFRNRLGGIVRSTLFIPVLSSMVLVGIVWRFLLAPDDGMISSLFEVFGIPSVNWLGDSNLALIAVALVTVWKNLGYFLVIYYAGVMEVPEELYEASAIDGASPIRQFLHITVPALRPVTLLVVILGTIWSFQVFDLVYTLTGGGPGGATVTLVMALYSAGFKNFQMGYASAIAIVLFIIVLIVSVVQRRLLVNKE